MSCAEQDRLALIDRPQRLGLLPTWSFWNDPDVAKLARPVRAIGFAVGMGILGMLPLPLPIVLTLVMAWPVLFLGLTERWIRRRARLRRRALEQDRG